MSDSTVGRRQLLRAGGLLTLASMAAPALAACTGSGEPSASRTSRPTSTGGPVTIQWWDHFRPLTTLFQTNLFAPYKDEHANVTVQSRQLDAPQLAQALQLARRSNQLPDVHSIAGLQSSGSALVANGWFQPIDDFVDVAASPVNEFLFDGIHRFDGKVYTFPLFSGRWHDGAPWLNTALFEQANVDPADQPATWDDYRAVLRRLASGTPDNVHGLLLPMKDPSYLGSRLATLAMVAGAPGPGAVDWTSGEYVWASEPFLQAMEFLLALKQDGVLHPGSASMGPRDARARWAAGQAAIFMWGPWFIGGLMVEESDAVERGIDVWRMPAPSANRSPVYTGPASGPFWLSAQSKHPDVAADVMMRMTTDAFFTKLAGAMDQPPILLDLVEKAGVHPAYLKNVGFQQQDVRTGPVPEVRNADVGTMLTQMRDIHPDPGEIVQAVLTGSESDYRGALRTYNDKLSAERDRAIRAAQAKGAEVSLDDWVFDNWDRAKDYDQDMYKHS